MQIRILIFLYALVGLVPYFQALDKVDTQIMYLNVINCLNIFLLFKSNRDKSFEKLQKSLSNLPVVFMGLFFLWSCITIIPL